MAIIKKNYELSVWHETLNDDDKKIEQKGVVFGAHNMGYIGRATEIAFKKQLKGTQTLTFKMVSRFFDNQLGKFVDNEFCQYLFNEQKVKLKYDDEWFEFYIKNISETKTKDALIYTYSCENAFIDELARNGYGKIFDTELYNNVEEIGVFTDEILEDSIWSYSPKHNTGDFTEYIEEKLYRIPVSYFGNLEAYKLNYQIPNAEKIENIYTKETRLTEMGDDYAREQKCFWDNYNEDIGVPLLGEITPVFNDGFIYVPYSQLGFCYIQEGFAATEEPYVCEVDGFKSYALAPQSIDPTSLIQFIAIPQGEIVNIDESGLLLDKDYTYVMTLQQWNDNVVTTVSYDVEHKKMGKGNKIVTYTGYLDNINNIEIKNGKKIKISDRTEVNVSKEIDQYVTVYNNKSLDYQDFYSADKWVGGVNNYRVCSSIATRVIVPQLARNLIQNGTNITNTAGWEVMSLTDAAKDVSSTLENKWDTNATNSGYLELNACAATDNGIIDSSYFSFLNFGVVGQEETISKQKTYCLMAKTFGEFEQSFKIIIAKGGLSSKGNYLLDDDERIEFVVDSDLNGQYLLFRPNFTISNPYFCIELEEGQILELSEIHLFEAYTKGADMFEDGYYKYSGRDIYSGRLDYWNVNVDYLYRLTNESEILLDTDVMAGDVYEYHKYFIQQLVTKDDKIKLDTFAAKDYLSLIDETKYTEDDFTINTNYIDLNKCPYYTDRANNTENDCGYCNGQCMYQKYGYCPYLFKTEKHCRKVRTLNGSKSNRFNLTQELSKVFEVYPIYYTDHLENGKIKDTAAAKTIFYITEKGKDNKLGFRYEKNLANISRTIDSKEIVTKLYVEDVDSELSKTGLSTIKLAEDNPSRDNYIIDFSYYILKGILNKEKTEYDLYGKNDEDLGFLKKLGYLNLEYDKLSNKIINLQDESYTQLVANIDVNLTGIETAQQEMNKTKKKLERYKSDGEENDTYKNYQNIFEEQKNILYGLVESTFSTNGTYYSLVFGDNVITSAQDFLDAIDSDYSLLSNFKEEIMDNHLYFKYGLAGQYSEEFNQISKWKKEKASYLKQINSLSLAFYQKYESFLKEGTWSDGNYLTDNAYYLGAKEVAAQGSIPKLTYSISVTDLSNLDKDYEFDVADTTFIEDKEMFGINERTGLVNHLKVIISEITYDLDVPTKNSIQVQNYTTQFEDIFEQLSATVQTLSFNENIYRRSSNFTANQNVATDSLQGTLDGNDLTLVETDNKNISIDSTGQKGSDINNHNNKYKLDGQGLFFSNDGGQHWQTGVTPNGINADYIKTGTLDASKVQIVDGDYIYFLWDKSGITAYREPIATADNKNLFSDFSRFNKYGLSLVEDGKIRLRAGYEFLGSQGNINSEQDITTENNIGFYLYNKNGDVVFRTENDDDVAARLSLAGEMYVSDNLLNTQSGTYSYNFGNNDKMRLASDIFLKANYYENEGLLNSTISVGNLTTTFAEYYKEIGTQTFSDNQAIVFTIDENFRGNYKTETKKLSVRVTGQEVNNIFSEVRDPNLGNDNDDPVEGYCKRIQLSNFVIVELDENGENVPSYESDVAYLTNFTGETNNYYNFSGTTSRMYVYMDSEGEDLDSSPTQLPNSTSLMYLTLNGDNYESSLLEREVYLYEAYGYTMPYSNEIYNPAEIIPSENGIAVYLNNQSISDSESGVNAKAGRAAEENYFKRLISCAKSEDGTIKNVFSILSSGSMYLGGTLKEYVEGDETFGNVSNLRNYIKIEEDSETISLVNGKISIGGEDLVNGIVNALGGQIADLRQQIANSGLIAHSHGIGGAGVTSTSKSLNSTYNNVNVNGEAIQLGVNESSKSLTINSVLVSAMVAPTGGGVPSTNTIAIPIANFIDGLKLQIAQGETTETSGSVSGGGGGSSLTSGYIVEAE